MAFSVLQILQHLPSQSNTHQQFLWDAELLDSIFIKASKPSKKTHQGLSSGCVCQLRHLHLHLQLVAMFWAVSFKKHVFHSVCLTWFRIKSFRKIPSHLHLTTKCWVACSLHEWSFLCELILYASSSHGNYVDLLKC